MLESKQKELDGLQQNLALLQQTKSSLEQALSDLVYDCFISSVGWFGCFIARRECSICKYLLSNVLQECLLGLIISDVSNGSGQIREILCSD